MRTQPPVLSPLSFSALLTTGFATSAALDHALRNLHELLLREFSADDALLTASGTHALQLAIGAAVSSRAHQRIVALPAFSCFDVATAAIGADTRILLYDIDPNTLAPEPSSFERALQRGARTAVIAPLYGVPVAWPQLESIAARHDALLIEDAAQGHGARWHERALGSIGAISVLSFGRGKGWTGGGGGALLWRGPGADLLLNSEVLQQSTFAKLGGFAKAAAQWVLGRPLLYGIPSGVPWLGLGETKYREPTQPRSMAAAEAALLLGTRQAASREAASRREAGEHWRLRLSAVMHTIAPPEGGVSGHLRFPVRFEGVAAASIVHALRRLGAAPSYPTTLAELPAVRAALVEHGEWPGAAALARELFTLPTHSLLTRIERERIVDYLQQQRRNIS